MGPTPAKRETQDEEDERQGVQGRVGGDVKLRYNQCEAQRQQRGIRPVVVNGSCEDEEEGRWPDEEYE